MDVFLGLLTTALPGMGGFAGSFLALYMWCPNRRCCQMKTVRGVLEKPRNKSE
jgi:hypothetical protein